MFDQDNPLAAAAAGRNALTSTFDEFGSPRCCGAGSRNPVISP